MNNKIAMIGAGSWATALAVSLSGAYDHIYIWARREEQAEEINEQRSNDRYLPEITIPRGITAFNSLSQVLSGAGTVVFGVPANAFRETLQAARPYIEKNTLVINTAKGLEEETRLRLSEVFIKEMGDETKDRYVVLSGPSHAEEVARGVPTAVVVASTSLHSAQAAQDIFMNNLLRVYTNPDVTGVELGGALKNIVALGTGISGGLGYGDNTTAALITRGLAEIARLGKLLGANPLTFTGLAGVGDLMVTCTSKHSRNRRAGMEIGKGSTLAAALEKVNMVVEGVRTTRAVYKLAQEINVEMPITEQMYQVLFENLDPRTAVSNLMGRGKRHEVEEIARWNAENRKWKVGKTTGKPAKP